MAQTEESLSEALKRLGENPPPASEPRAPNAPGSPDDREPLYRTTGSPDDRVPLPMPPQPTPSQGEDYFARHPGYVPPPRPGNPFEWQTGNPFFGAVNPLIAPVYDVVSQIPVPHTAFTPKFNVPGALPTPQPAWVEQNPGYVRPVAQPSPTVFGQSPNVNPVLLPYQPPGMPTPIQTTTPRPSYPTIAPQYGDETYPTGYPPSQPTPTEPGAPQPVGQKERDFQAKIIRLMQEETLAPTLESAGLRGKGFMFYLLDEGSRVGKIPTIDQMGQFNQDELRAMVQDANLKGYFTPDRINQRDAAFREQMARFERQRRETEPARPAYNPPVPQYPQPYPYRPSYRR